MECSLERSLELANGCDFIIGKVVQFHIDDQINQNGRIDQRILAAVSHWLEIITPRLV
ncbi:hypothetical protein PJ311_09060 [Bacillus sp. CLL-7-23]|uniref:Uncharacterized protein n=1 Tax=Bacillus changyiensis TaxID=3004103 RepID=A0ABT4X3L1_9BACI|nr:hypothetical protein [Bacillus changyiensis]MDA7026755.1 hypothetical protein [Bacillus changyiensis]